MTLIELLVGIALAGVLILCAWQAFDYCYKGYSYKKKLSSELQDQYVLELKLRKRLDNQKGCGCALGDLIYDSPEGIRINYGDSIRNWYPHMGLVQADCPILSNEYIIINTQEHKSRYRFIISCGRK